MLLDIAIKSAVAGLFASVACGMGALPLFIRGIDLSKHTGASYSFAGGLMFAASVYNLIWPGLTMADSELNLAAVLPVIVGMLLGTTTLWFTDRYLPRESGESTRWQKWGGRTGVLIFLTMSIHSIPEGVAVGVGFASEAAYGGHLGSYIAIAISIHNIPEGLAVAIPMRAAGASVGRCFLAAFLTSLPQPIAAVPASLISGLFESIMPMLMGFAAGAMIFLVLLELIPDALTTSKPVTMAWSFMFGFCTMLLLQVLL